MSRKGSDEPSAARIRENQRRSRARRKDLIEDLQRRVQMYEQKGVAATQEMQQAARKVAQENARLRSLLAQVGVSKEQTEAYLRAFDEVRGPQYVPTTARRETGDVRENNLASNGAHTWSETRLVAGTCQLSPAMSDDHEEAHHHAHASQEDISTAHPANAVGVNLQARESWASPAAENTSTPPIQDNTNCRQDDITRTTDPTLQDANASASTDCPNTTTCFCAPAPTPPPTTTQAPKSSLEISCDAAATIIAGMRGHSYREGEGESEREAIRASLGCVDERECHIKNSTVLQLMGDS